MPAILIAARGRSGIAHSVVTESRIAAQREADRKRIADWEAERRLLEEAEAKKKMPIKSATDQLP
jgi:hypothetical protein